MSQLSGSTASRNAAPDISSRDENPADTLRPLQWRGGIDGGLELLDQTRLPAETVHILCRDVESLREAIQKLRVRGAPAIGCAAAYGVVIGLNEMAARGERNWLAALPAVCERLTSSRPTAVNLAWAAQRMSAAAQSLRSASLDEARTALLAEAHRIRDEDAAMCRAIGRHGAELIRDGDGILTHCNAGALATSEWGTALALFYTAHRLGRRFTVYVDETRPLLQGSRLTAWELMRAGIDVVLICDNMAAQVMREGRVRMVVTGADRIAANGDTANKIGTYGAAVLAKAHNLPFYVAAPSSTIDLDVPDGATIPIEHRDPDEVRQGFGRATAPANVRCFCPAFDVTPGGLITGLVTERGLMRPVTADAIRKAFSDNKLGDRA